MGGKIESQRYVTISKEVLLKSQKENRKILGQKKNFFEAIMAKTSPNT